MTRKRLGAAQWARLLEEWAHSGLSVPAFCQQRGLSSSTMKGWLYKPELKGAVGNTCRARRAARTTPTETSMPSRSVSSPGFVPVRLTETAAVQASETNQRTAAIAVILGGGRRVVVEQGFDPETLRQVVAALESGSC
jgi:hypothetical protein